jgi:hypothetical protein
VLDVPVSFYFDDVTPDAAAAARSEASEGGGESTPQRHEPDPMMRRETPELVRAYYRIAGPQIRHRLFRPHQGHRRRLHPKCLKPDQGGLSFPHRMARGAPPAHPQLVMAQGVPAPKVQTQLCDYQELAEGNENRPRRERKLRPRPPTQVELAHDFFLLGDPRFSLPNMPPLHFG